MVYCRTSFSTASETLCSAAATAVEVRAVSVGACLLVLASAPACTVRARR